MEDNPATGSSNQSVKHARDMAVANENAAGCGQRFEPRALQLASLEGAAGEC